MRRADLVQFTGLIVVAVGFGVLAVWAGIVVFGIGILGFGVSMGVTDGLEAEAWDSSVSSARVADSESNEPPAR